jgi:exonuclease SbcD
MKVLHTGDWHVGRTLFRRQRLDEAQAVLDEIAEIAREEEVDLVLACGDIYEHFAPSADAERIVYQTLLELRDTGASVVVLAGNHDNARRFGAVEPVMAQLGIYMAPAVRRPDEGGILEVRTRDEKERAQIALLPWVPERALFGAEQMMGLQEEPYQAYAEKLPRLIKALCEPLDHDAVTILAGHLFVSGARVGGGERELTIGHLFAISAAALPTTPQYIALGHVHRPQEVPSSPVPARYAGSTLQLDFSEAEQQKSVFIVNLEPGKPARVTERPLMCGRQLLDVKCALDEVEEHKGSEDSAFLRVTLECEGPQPGLADQVRSVLPNAIEVRLDYPREDPQSRADQLRRLSPNELFDRYYCGRYGAEPADELMQLFNTLLEEAQGAPAEA